MSDSASIDSSTVGSLATGAAPASGGAAATTAARRDWGAAARRALETGALGLLGFAGMLAIWALVAAVSSDLPSPAEAFSALATLLQTPFHDNGPNDKGIGVHLYTSLQRVFIGFSLAVIVAVPLGFVMGASKAAWAIFNPVAQLLRPVSPLAWFPLGIVVLKDAPTAAIFVIFITALWPTVINTAFGVASVPDSHKNVARVFRFGKVKYVRHVLLPYSLPSIITGMRISMGIAWMVIVAAEMLSGGSGIGFFVWDAYNASNLANVAAAIFLIGGIGMALDYGFTKLQSKVSYSEVS
ncbi:MAG: nitrate ABC transporter permease [Thermoleophilaceae bacterium]|nr:nitrate ABC transporter permease [Thermoleophilaceae bacterium]